MNTLNDINYAFRLMLNNPKFTALTVFVMTTGLTLCIHMFSFINGTITAPLPFEGGDRIIGEILSGSYSDGADAVAASASGDDTIVLGQVVGDEANGKGEFSTARLQFTSNDSGQISIWIYAITNDELYADNVKIYPLED